LAAERVLKRHELLAATEVNFAKLKAQVDAGRLRDPAKFGLHAGRVVNRQKMAKLFNLEITEGSLSFSPKVDAIIKEAGLDGIYVIRTSLEEGRASAGEVVKTYELLANLEHDCFQNMTTVDVEIRPVRHRLTDRVRAHVFICMFGAHLTWHLRRARAPLALIDEKPPERSGPVAAAKRSAAASSEAARRSQLDGAMLRPFQDRLDHLATLTRNTNKVRVTDVTFDQLTEATPTQQKAFELLGIPISVRIV